MLRHNLLLAAWLLPVLAVCITGCDPSLRAGTQNALSEDDQPVEVVIGRINENTQDMNFLLRGNGVKARGRWEGESFDLTGTLLYRKPRDLYLSLEPTLSGKGMEIGSNATEFWVWKRLGHDRYWWGLHANIDRTSDADIPIRPDHLLDMIGLQPLPGQDEGPDRPLFHIEPQYYELLYASRDTHGGTHVARRIRVNRHEPFLINEITYYDGFGHPVVVAKLSAYATVTGSEVLAPRHIEMKWLDQNSWFDMTIRKMENAGTGSPAVQKKFISPMQLGRNVGEVERVDRPSRAPTPAPTGERPEPGKQ